jgi:hypothetical protein
MSVSLIGAFTSILLKDARFSLIGPILGVVVSCARSVAAESIANIDNRNLFIMLHFFEITNAKLNKKWQSTKGIAIILSNRITADISIAIF